MKKHPFLMALLLVGCVFVFFFISVLVIASFLGRPTVFPVGKKVAVVELQGVIDSSRELMETIVDFRDDDSVKAIVLRINSPGGAVGPAQEVYEEIKKAAKVKPVVVSMGSVAASGGYYVAVPAQRILANPGTITGSIGVIMQFTNFEELLAKIGLKSEVVKSGSLKDIGSSTRPMTEQDRQVLQTLIDDVHQQFMTAVAEGRKMDLKKVKALADGRIFTGRQALQAGLVDELGNLQDAIAIAGKLGGIEGKPQVIYPPRVQPGVLNYLFEEGTSQVRRVLSRSSLSGLQFLWTGIE
ncbi:signal peptide peptidase SppA [Geothermobacter hydrogeniphilus]|uniref:Signal peptide peptidase SppA n=1 Tax=Geothermobacter hydrogeniphilus TaxID=1969733 RepID=A0A2K2HBX2_9BACT|nr:signal peptide peptidase SppA [Geothermobacter hydrogeniphilus]PNU20741.1 signal peptide peptidase SppA [Geothermobacter hydrogeniphilus]